ncbi:TPA: hypothetical protein U2L98_000540 [Enterobacter hormaechei]|uniref:hypothetical protein n=1 Tax=Enterobacter hormaechei TaxID=158836 RepID=UPI000F86D5F7|nr:hypothetical protein [Enterobacter hormaechei]MCE1444256.1 hypothetical protein [Enterobacter hormaechei]MCE1452626.1 hypothetical protein [Enterobacter hormaechei]RTO92210.1 hypothetical protein EKN54_02510 [Enterobacter hormaechei]HEM8101542.1 hypothetical protein [Enterobacter hormaechei]HEM8123734.1 hypothetical protein [Enterobacter hormaechei]
MAIDFKVKATGIDVSTSGYRDHVNLEVRGVQVSDLVSEIEGKALFQEIDLDDYIDWAEAAGHIDDILDRLDADDVIAWLHSNGYLETES